MAKQNYYALPGVDYVNGALVPADRIVSLEPAEAAFDLLEGRIVLGNTQPPGIVLPPALLATDVFGLRRGDNPALATVDDLEGFLDIPDKVATKNRQVGVEVDVREYVEGLDFSFGQPATNAQKVRDAIAMHVAQAAHGAFKFPPLSFSTSEEIVFPKELSWVKFEKGFTWRRGTAFRFGLFESAYDRAHMQDGVGSPYVVSNAIVAGAGNSLQTGFPVANASFFKRNMLCKVCSEDEIPRSVPFDAGKTKLAKMGRFGRVSKVDTTSTPNVVFFYGEWDDRANFTTEIVIIPVSEDYPLLVEGGRFSTDTTALDPAVAANDKDYFTVLGRVRPRWRDSDFVSGMGKAVQFTGCFGNKHTGSHFSELQNSAVLGYGSVSTGCESPVDEDLEADGWMRHAVDRQVFYHSPVAKANRQYEYYGRTRNARARNIRDFGLGHSGVSPHAESINDRISGVLSVDGWAGPNALGAGISARGPNSQYDDFDSFGRGVGIEVNDQVSGGCTGFRATNGRIYDTSTAGFLSSLLTSSPNSGTLITDCQVERVTHRYKRGVSISLTKGDYKFRRWEAYLSGSNGQSNNGMIQLSADGVYADFIDLLFDAQAYTANQATTPLFVLAESAARAGRLIRFLRCTVKGTFAGGLIDAKTPVATGANAPVYKFIGCDLPAGIVTVANQGTAVVTVE